MRQPQSFEVGALALELNPSTVGILPPILALAITLSISISTHDSYDKLCGTPQLL